MGRQDVDVLINNQNGIINSVREVRYYFQIFSKFIYIKLKLLLLLKLFFIYKKKENFYYFIILK